MQLRREPLCRHCRERGQTTAATEVDHIKARRDGGSDAFDNLQSLCKSCHSRKTARGG
ncbi:MAG: HNH endonuclease [Caldilineaceae bacterium]|nr:HNH endonuclease [Caldilineaceae bacterium]